MRKKNSLAFNTIESVGRHPVSEYNLVLGRVVQVMKKIRSMSTYKGKPGDVCDVLMRNKTEVRRDGRGVSSSWRRS